MAEFKGDIKAVENAVLFCGIRKIFVGFDNPALTPGNFGKKLADVEGAAVGDQGVGHLFAVLFLKISQNLALTASPSAPKIAAVTSGVRPVGVGAVIIPFLYILHLLSDWNQGSRHHG